MFLLPNTEAEVPVPGPLCEGPVQIHPLWCTVESSFNYPEQWSKPSFLWQIVPQLLIPLRGDTRSLVFLISPPKCRVGPSSPLNLPFLSEALLLLLQPPEAV